MHISIPVKDTMEFINTTEISPLISHCEVKVCYVGQQPNRNGTVITKAVATEMGKKLPGSPVVGYFNEKTDDFEGHNREIILNGNEMRILDTTRPYGFVPTNAQVWFQKFEDDGVEHEYLVTECYIWTDVYPEAQRIIDKGNNQSMELNSEKSNGFWSREDNSGSSFFIYNEALIEKLCILGEGVEPCFEGAQFKKEFSLENDIEFQEFKNQLFSMMNEVQETLKKGGSQFTMKDNKNMEAPIEEFEKKPKEEETPKEEKASAPAEKKEEEKKDKKYDLNEVVEYQDLKKDYETLQNKYSTLEQEKANLETEVSALKEFKLVAERQSKQTMIDSFYMLSDEDKKDVMDNIDNYSLDTIEAKLSIICVRNKVDFNLKEEKPDNENIPAGLFNLNSNESNDNAPAWIQAVKAHSQNNN